MERPFDEIDEEDQTWLAHDWGVYSQDDLDAYPLSQTYVSELLSISETIEVMVGPEVSALAGDDSVVASLLGRLSTR